MGKSGKRGEESKSVAGLRKKVTSLDKKVTAIGKDVAFITKMMRSPVQAQLLLSGRIKPGEKVVTSANIGIDYARLMRDRGQTDQLKELGMSDKEIAELDEDFEHEEETENSTNS